MDEFLPVTAEDWSALRRATPARVGLARSGHAITTHDMLAFDIAHARACDAVASALDAEALERALPGHRVIRVRSTAPDRPTYLRRPDLGRRVAASALKSLPCDRCDVAIILADGLSGGALQRHGPPLVAALMPLLDGLSVGPLVIAHQARVSIADEVGAAMGARISVILIGERPGLTDPHSLSIYMTYGPRIGRSDAERNCISNIHHHGGLTYAEASQTLAWLLRESLRLGFSGVDLKDRSPRSPTGSLLADPNALTAPDFVSLFLLPARQS